MRPAVLFAAVGAAAMGAAAARFVAGTARAAEMPEGFTVTAHSGSMGLPDNSIEAMEAGVAAGADVVEFDLRYNAKGEPILSHDEAEDAVPLSAVFAFLQAHPGVRANVDVKDTSHLETVEPLADACGVKDRLFYTGVREKDVPAVREKSPNIPYWLNADVPRALPLPGAYKKLIQKIRDLGAVGINLYHGPVTPAFVRAFHAAGLPVSVWTVNERRDILRMLAAKPDNITSRKPDLVRAILDARAR